jgi:hypothetical protein
MLTFEVSPVSLVEHEIYREAEQREQRNRCTYFGDGLCYVLEVGAHDVPF